METPSSVAERENLHVTRKDVQAFVRSQGQRQVFAARPQYKGTIAATWINDR